MSATTRQRKKSVLRRFIIPVAASAVLAYFAYHAVNGEFGMAGRERIEHQVAALEAELRVLTDEREHIATRVSLLRPESLDPDMVDERARANLNVVHVNELAILRPAAR
ncbi:FtsB family cell division protein [Pannonibacter carbonis]|uniref:FtsB family cell division protein n=1 Tax=Pannonibacter carbonis TaxID=2067569 RepID=UPI001AD93091|nr:septum formation initiator family protein [Pannonibacter carbonis]